MTSLEPLKSVMSVMSADDTSLALPSVNQFRSGQQRVLEQVQSVRRTKSRHSSSSRNGSASLSPTSPVYDSVFVDASKSLSSTSNGSVFFGNGLSNTLSLENYISRQAVNGIKGSTVKRSTAASTYQYEKSYAPVSFMKAGQFNTSRSEPDLAFHRSMNKRSAPSKRLLSSSSTNRMAQSRSQFIVSTISQRPPVLAANGTAQTKTNSQFVCSPADVSKTSSKPPADDGTTKSKADSGSGGVADITMKEAVEYLSKGETYQHCGASYIQHNTFIDESAKEEVLKLNGIPPLVALLHSPSLQVNQTASAALRNLSFKSTKSKEEIHRYGGIEEAVALLRDTDSAEIQKQLTGLLWNLSSVDSVKPDLLKSALPVLMERVILPHTTGPDRTNSDPEAFFHTTACLRNLSSSMQSNRQAMRKCRGLIDSLVKYVKDSVEEGKPDNKSVENCVCILHNLTFQLEAEAPALFTRITSLIKPVSRNHSQSDTGPIGCFSPQSKSLEHQVSCAMSQLIVQKLNGMQVLGPLLKSKKVNLQKNVVALVGNLTKNPNLHNAIARKALPELLGILRAGTKEGNESDDTLAMACQTANYLLIKEPEMGKHLLDNNLIDSLKDLSQNGYFPKSRKAAALLLYSLWSEKDLQSFLKKQGMSKSSFVNEVTTAAHKSVQIVD
ncbi:plakophilin-1 isoform X3 [Chaetodon auriga]|uniref:plakophilin-1 isoform X3 n=1 Tax=Chaetodon auriga TaxID=39042 RepID=UPI004032E98C